MNYGIDIATLGDYADPRPVVQLAQAAEAAGWQGLFVWDHTAFCDYAAAGVTWWLESLHGFRGSFDELKARVMAGPAV